MKYWKYFFLLLPITLCYGDDVLLSLRESIILSLKFNQNLEISKLRLEQAKAELSLIKTKKHPRLYVNCYAGMAQFKGGIPISNSFLLNIDKYQTDILFYGEGGIYSRWLIYDNKSTYYEVKEKEMFVEVFSEELEQKKSEIIYHTTNFYIKAIHSKEKIMLLQKQIQILKSLKKEIEVYYNSGFLSFNEIVTIEAQIFKLEDLLLIENEKHHGYCLNLKLLLNIPDSRNLVLEKIDENLFSNFDILPVDNSRIKQSQIAVAIAQLKFNRARKHNSIQFNLDTYLRYSTGQSWAVGIGLNWPRFDFGERKALSKISQFQYVLSQKNDEITRQQIEYEIEISYQKMCLTRKRKNLYQARFDSLYQRNINNNITVFKTIDEIKLKYQKQMEASEFSIIKLDRDFDYYFACLDYLNKTNHLEDLIK